MSEPTTIPITSWRDALIDPWFRMCLFEALESTDFVANIDRLYGTKILHIRAPIERMVDEACGAPAVSDEDMAKFCEIVFDQIYTRLERPKEFTWLCPMISPGRLNTGQVSELRGRLAGACPGGVRCLTCTTYRQRLGKKRRPP